MLTGAQMRMARAYLRWSVADLATASGVSTATIKRMEQVDDVPPVMVTSLSKIRAALEAKGIEMPADEGLTVRARSA